MSSGTDWNLRFRGTASAIVVGRSARAVRAAFVARCGRTSVHPATTVAPASAATSAAHAIVAVSVAWISAIGFILGIGL